MGLYAAHNEREAIAEAANEEGVGATDGFWAERWNGPGGHFEAIEESVTYDLPLSKPADH